jgi:hypothetical protein
MLNLLDLQEVRKAFMNRQEISDGGLKGSIPGIRQPNVVETRFTA